MLTIITTLILAQPSVEPTTDTVDWAGSLVKWCIDQVAHKNYVALIAAIVMALTYLAKIVLKDRINSDHLPWISAGLGMMTSLAASLLGVTHGMPLVDVADLCITGLTTGAMASGFWSLVGRRMSDWLDKKFPKIKPPDSPLEVK